jgi:hypothetical protein
MTIVRYEPWTLLSRFQRQFERALGETLEDAPAASVSWIPPAGAAPAHYRAGCVKAR